MDFRKIVGPTRFDAGAAGADVEYALPHRAGGKSAKGVSVHVKIIAGSANAKVGFKIKHGPDGTVTAVHTSTASATISASPSLMVFDAGSAMIGEYIHPTLVVGGTAGSDYVVVEVYEMRKPF